MAAINNLPWSVHPNIWLAFGALYLPRLHEMILYTSFDLLNSWITLANTCVFLGHPLQSPYLLTFIRDPCVSCTFVRILSAFFQWEMQHGNLFSLYNALRGHFIHGAPLPSTVNWKSGITLVSGGDGKAPIPRDRCLGFKQAIAEYTTTGQFSAMTPADQQIVRNTADIFHTIHVAPKRAGILGMMRKQEEGIFGITGCSRKGCKEKSIAVCARCQCVRYCSRACQRRDWSVHHRLRCFETNFRSLHLSEPKTKVTIHSKTSILVALIACPS